MYEKFAIVDKSTGKSIPLNDVDKIFTEITGNEWDKKWYCASAPKKWWVENRIKDKKKSGEYDEYIKEMIDDGKTREEAEESFLRTMNFNFIAYYTNWHDTILFSIPDGGGYQGWEKFKEMLVENIHGTSKKRLLEKYDECKDWTVDNWFTLFEKWHTNHTFTKFIEKAKEKNWTIITWSGENAPRPELIKHVE